MLESGKDIKLLERLSTLHFFFHSTDLSLREYSFERRAHYEKEVSKSMRDFIVMDDSDVYDSDENEQRDKLMWGDVQSVG